MIWVKIKEFENYSVNEYGKIRNDNTKRILKNHFDKAGYELVFLSQNGVRKNCRVHRLVAKAFIPNYNDYKEVNHIDEIKSNNHVSNLEWCNRRQNIDHSIHKFGTKKKNVMNMITKEVFESAYHAENKTGIPSGNINKCCNGKLKSAGKININGKNIKINWCFV